MVNLKNILSAITDRPFPTALLILAVLVAAGGCGKSQPRSDAVVSAAAAGPSHESKLLHGKDRRRVSTRPTHSAERERLACYEGSVHLAKFRRAADFQVRCKPLEPGERVSAQVAVAHEGGGEVQIKDYRQRPLVLGDARDGFCFRDHYDFAWKLHCRAEGDRSILIKGRIWVGADICHINIALISFPKPEPCRGNCGLVYEYNPVILAEGPPRGC